MASILAGIGMSLLPAVIPYIGKAIGFAAKSLPMIGKAGSFISKGIGIAKNVIGVAGNVVGVADNIKSSFDELNTRKPATILPDMDRGSREGGFSNYPKFDDEMVTPDAMMRGRGSYMKPLSRDQYGGYNRMGRGMNLSSDPSYVDYERNNYDVYSSNSLGNGFGSTSTTALRNDRTANRNGYMNRELVRTREQTDMYEQEEYQPSRKFIRRVPSNNTSRFSETRVSNLNLGDDLDDLFR